MKLQAFAWVLGQSDRIPPAKNSVSFLVESRMADRLASFAAVMFRGRGRGVQGQGRSGLVLPRDARRVELGRAGAGAEMGEAKWESGFSRLEL